MAQGTDFVHAKRQEAWAFGRALRESLLEDYCREYHLTSAPAPALIIDELIRDFMEVDLFYDPLPTTVFAKATFKDGRPTITINSLTREIRGVKDEEGVQNVAKMHEAIHVVRDLKPQDTRQGAFEGFDLPKDLTCYRSSQDAPSAAKEREFRAEEAGRAAVVSYPHLLRSEAFLELRHRHRQINNARAWSCLYQSAGDLGINISALVTQLKLEGWITVIRNGSSYLLKVQPLLEVQS